MWFRCSQMSMRYTSFKIPIGFSAPALQRQGADRRIGRSHPPSTASPSLADVPKPQRCRSPLRGQSPCPCASSWVGMGLWYIYIYMCVCDIYKLYNIFSIYIYIIIIYYIYYIYMFILYIYIYVYIILIHVWCFLRRAAAWPTNTHNSDHIPNFPIHFLTLPFKFHTRAQRY